jgi:tetratricopeptide (TPR) repeat protein
MEPLSPGQVVLQVAALLDRGRTDQARSLLKVALASDPEHTGLLLQSAWTDYLDDHYDSAFATVNQVLLADPDDESARLLRYELLMQKSQHTDAEQVILGLLREYPGDPHYYARYADLMLKTINLAKAGELAREGLKYDPENAECLATATICDFIEKRRGATSHTMQQMLVKHPQSLRTLLLLVVALEERGDIRSASRVSQELVRADPGNESFVEMAREFRLQSHWSMLPMWPMQRWGWGASAAIWLAAVLGLRAVDRINDTLGTILTVVFVLYVIYTWTWSKILRRLL